MRDNIQDILDIVSLPMVPRSIGFFVPRPMGTVIHKTLPSRAGQRLAAGSISAHLAAMASRKAHHKGEKVWETVPVAGGTATVTDSHKV